MNLFVGDVAKFRTQDLSGRVTEVDKSFGILYKLHNLLSESHELRANRHSERQNMRDFNHLEEDATTFHGR